VSDELTPHVLAWIRQEVGSEVQSVQVLAGATSSSVYGVAVGDGERPLRLVLRLFTNKEWLTEEPHLAQQEADCLNKAQALDVPTPEVVAVDVDGRYCHHPAILTTHLPGQIQLNPTDLFNWLDKLAATLAQIHTLRADDFPWPYVSWLDRDKLHIPTWTQSPQAWQKAIEIVSQPEPIEPAIFIHRDYHPTNVLWQDGQISGVVDWVNGCRGPVSVDISHCRGNLFKMYGLAAADHFLATYQTYAPTPGPYNPYWDLATVLDTLPEPIIYPPWRHFGLPIPSLSVMYKRVDDFLITAVAKL
jgi:aminoglycoside phosphotransferase (APT) family kinase protein